MKSTPGMSELIVTVSELRTERRAIPSSSVRIGVSRGIDDSPSIAIGSPTTGVSSTETRTDSSTASGVSVGSGVLVDVGVTVGV